MSRQTAFPGIIVNSIRVRTSPSDDKGVIEEFGPSGVTTEFAGVKRAADLEPNRIRGIIEEAEELIGPLNDSFEMKYNLTVRGLPLPGSGKRNVIKSVQRRSVRLRARSFARIKNPFEPEILEVGDPSLNQGMTEVGEGLDYFDVSVWVSK